MKKVFKWLIGIIITIIVLVSAAFLIAKQVEYEPSTAATKAADNSTFVDDTYKFQGDDSKPVIIFYPGALVEPKSYSIWASILAKNGYTVYIAKFPLNLAIVDANAAKRVQSNHSYIIGGHSLGGTMAARYAAKNKKELRGVFFLASYPEKKGNLRNIKEPVLSITGSRDGVLNKENYKKAKKLLPKATDYIEINGGNHAGFGSYGKQKGDNKADISNADQQRVIADILLHWLNGQVN
ncbi:alpha/beta family hydrolase [Companilactobacillus jidongensis]|uniref:alpha/beta family hydrolase n=1 Tax=Companilactobacillus jidongensis TaxID=2486006 RepID=UPI000F77DC5F|nr:alpha/beta family hydrolase [Companilactobacillus jidongensis]